MTKHIHQVRPQLCGHHCRAGASQPGDAQDLVEGYERIQRRSAGGCLCRPESAEASGVVVMGIHISAGCAPLYALGPAGMKEAIVLESEIAKAYDGSAVRQHSIGNTLLRYQRQVRPASCYRSILQAMADQSEGDASIASGSCFLLHASCAARSSFRSTGSSA